MSLCTLEVFALLMAFKNNEKKQTLADFKLTSFSLSIY